MKKTKMSIGYMAMGLKPYWAQFAGMREKCEKHHQVLKEKFDSNTYEVVDVGIVDSEALARKAGEAFRNSQVQMVFCHMLTYASSEYIAPVVRELDVPVIMLNVQYQKALDFEQVKGLGDWLSEGITCAGIPEATAVLNRMGKQYDVITGHMQGDGRVDREINHWCSAARIKNRLANENVALFGRPYAGMMDLCIDETNVFNQFGSFVQHLDWQEIIEAGSEISGSALEEQLAYIKQIFALDGTMNPKDIEYIAKTAFGLDQLVEKYRLCAIATHYEIDAPPSQVDLVAALNPAMTMLMTKGIAGAPEGDMKSALAMVILKELAGEAMTAELYSMDFDTNTCLIGHSGACDAKISDEKATLKISNVFNGKKGKGYMTQYYPRLGPVTMLALTQKADGSFKLVAAEGESVEGPVLELGDTNLRARFPGDLRDFVNRWSMEGPTHHGVIGRGLHLEGIACVAKALGVELKVITTMQKKEPGSNA